MTGRIETGWIVSALRSTVRRARLAVAPTRARLSGRSFVLIADLALTQLGAPGVLTCCEYLARRWRHRVRHSTSGQATSTHPGHAVPASGTDALDHERS